MLFFSYLSTINTYASDYTIDLAILNEANTSGEIIVVNGDDIEIQFTITDPSGELSKDDRIQLRDLYTDKIIKKKKRGNLDSMGVGNVRFKTKNGKHDNQGTNHLIVEYVKKYNPHTVLSTSAMTVTVVPDQATVELLGRVAALEAELDAYHNRYVVGDTGPGGGTVFYVDSTGLHGLEVAPVSTMVGPKNWGCSGTAISSSLYTFGAGYSNTQNITSECAETGNAASAALDFSHGGETDWYLPSFNELNFLFKTGALNFDSGRIYHKAIWTSTQGSDSFASGGQEDKDSANAINWYNGSPTTAGKFLPSAWVLPIRTF